MSNTTRSTALFDVAKNLIPGGVNSPVRAFRGVGGVPRFIDHGAANYHASRFDGHIEPRDPDADADDRFEFLSFLTCLAETQRPRWSPC